MAQFITDEEAQNLGAVPMHGRKSAIRILIEIMEVGQQLHVTRSEWRWKHNPLKTLVDRVAKKTGHRFTTYNVLGRGAWIVKREE